jgi:hypothetical protein
MLQNCAPRGGLNWVCLGFFLMVAGCGGPSYGPKVKLSGTVTLDDKPLANASITFACTEPREPEFRGFNATAGADGQYTVEIYKGTYDLTITEAVTGDVGMASAMGGQDLKAASGELKVEVGTTDQTYDIKLVRGAVPPQ